MKLVKHGSNYIICIIVLVLLYFISYDTYLIRVFPTKIRKEIKLDRNVLEEFFLKFILIFFLLAIITDQLSYKGIVYLALVGYKRLFFL